MGFCCGIIGLPNVGKSTIFKALSASHVEAANYPFCTIQPNHAIVAVPDERLAVVAELTKSARAVPTTIEFLDIAGLVRGAASGEGLGNQFLAHIREVDAIIHVVRCFSDSQVSHVYESISPVRDVEIVETELLLADLETVEKRLDHAVKAVKVGDKSLRAEAELLAEVRVRLASGKCAKDLRDNDQIISQLRLLSSKPVLFVANIGEDDVAAESAAFRELRSAAEIRHAPLLCISGKLEAELNDLSSDERRSFLASLGRAETGLEALALSGYKLLDLITFFTANAREAHAWTVTEGTAVIDAAARVHSDFARGFIRAEVVAFADFRAHGGENGARERGLLRIEGRDYIVRDGDVINVRFNV